jgi:hypothetical protein
MRIPIQFAGITRHQSSRSQSATLIPKGVEAAHITPWTIGDWNKFFWTGCFPHETPIGPGICVRRAPSLWSLAERC